MFGKFAFREGAFSDCLEQTVFADVRLLTLNEKLTRKSLTTVRTINLVNMWEYVEQKYHSVFLFKIVLNLKFHR